MDGTFKIVNEPLKQLFTINTFFKNDSGNTGPVDVRLYDQKKDKILRPSAACRIIAVGS